MIYCSANQIKQACSGILVNASEAVAENGEVLFKTSNPDEDHIRIEIVDNGIGINEEDISHIFEPFFSTKQVGHGTGLGLSICMGLVRSHGGEIEVESERGRGARFIVKLPVAPAGTPGKDAHG